MKPLPLFTWLKTALLIVPLSFCLSGGRVAQAGDRYALTLGTIRPSRSHDRAESRPGYLKVYSATDEFDDGGVPFYAHSSYTIYTTDGKLVRNVANHISRSDEIPELVALPPGSYTVEARSANHGYVRLRVIIEAGQRTILDLDLGEEKTFTRLAHN